MISCSAGSTVAPATTSAPVTCQNPCCVTGVHAVAAVDPPPRTSSDPDVRSKKVNSLTFTCPCANSVWKSVGWRILEIVSYASPTSPSFGAPEEPVETTTGEKDWAVTVRPAMRNVSWYTGPAIADLSVRHQLCSM